MSRPRLSRAIDYFGSATNGIHSTELRTSAHPARSQQTSIAARKRHQRSNGQRIRDVMLPAGTGNAADLDLITLTDDIEDAVWPLSRPRGTPERQRRGTRANNDSPTPPLGKNWSGTAVRQQLDGLGRQRRSALLVGQPHVHEARPAGDPPCRSSGSLHEVEHLEGPPVDLVEALGECGVDLSGAGVPEVEGDLAKGDEVVQVFLVDVAPGAVAR